MNPQANGHDEPVQWSGAPQCYRSGEPFVVKIRGGCRAWDRQEPTPQIGDRVRVLGRDGTEFIARIHAIRARTEAHTFALADDPPWAEETFRERRARGERRAVENARIAQLRQDHGLCVLCGEASLDDCRCVRGLRADQARQAQRAAAEASEREHTHACEAYNREAAARRESLTLEAVEDAIVQSGGRLVMAGRILGVEQFRKHKWERGYPDTPNSRFLPQWVRRNAPQLLDFARELRESAKPATTPRNKE